jgi:hypothetical protein
VTVLEVCVRRLGVHRGAVAAANVAQWALAADSLGHFPTTVEYAEWWAISERTAWRHRARCHSALGDDWQNVVESIAREIDERSPRAVMKLRVRVAA